MITQKRNTAIWQDLTDFKYRGLKNTLSSLNDSVNFQGKTLINNVVFVIDEGNRIKQERLSDLIQLSNDQLAGEKEIVDIKADTQRTVIAIKIATNDYIISAAQYANEVKLLIMDAKILAQEMSENEVTLSEQRKILAEEKADIKSQSVDLDIQLEGIKQKHVEIDKLKAQLSVAKANTQLVMAEIDVKKADLAVVNAEVQKSMSAVDKINLTVEVSMVLADLIVKQIAGVRLESEQADINAISQSLSIKLDATLALMDRRLTNINEKIGNEEKLFQIVEALQTAKMDEMQVWLDQSISTGLVQDYKESATDDFLQVLKNSEATITDWAIRWMEALGKTKEDIWVQQVDDAVLADQTISDGYKRQESSSYTTKKLYQKIYRG